jgi:hypothetical protein
VLPFGCGVHGLAVMLARGDGLPGLVGVATESSPAGAERSSNFIPATLGRQVTVPLARGRHLTLLVEREGIPPSTSLGIVAARRGQGLDEARQARLRPAGRRLGRGRGPAAGMGVARHPSHQRISGGPATMRTKSPASMRFSRARFGPRREIGAVATDGARADGVEGAADGCGSPNGATRGSPWHFGHRFVPSGRLAQQDRQNIGRCAGPAR